MVRFIVSVFSLALIIATVLPASAEKPALGTETVALIKRGVFHLSCADATAILQLLKAGGYKPVEYLVMGGESDNDFDTLPEGTKNVLIEFTSSMDMIVNTLSVPFGNKEDILGAIETNIMGHDVENIMNAATATYLGVVSEKNLDMYIQSEFCGAEVSKDFQSPLDISEDLIVEAIEKRIRSKNIIK